MSVLNKVESIEVRGWNPCPQADLSHIKEVARKLNEVIAVVNTLTKMAKEAEHGLK